MEHEYFNSLYFFNCHQAINSGLYVYTSAHESELKQSHVGPRISPVQEVDGVTPVVLDVPAERGETHAHIKPGYLHARDIHIDVGEHGLLQHRHVVQVPARVGILLSGEGKEVLRFTSGENAVVSLNRVIK